MGETRNNISPGKNMRRQRRIKERRLRGEETLHNSSSKYYRKTNTERNEGFRKREKGRGREKYKKFDLKWADRLPLKKNKGELIDGMGNEKKRIPFRELCGHLQGKKRKQQGKPRRMTSQTGPLGMEEKSERLGKLDPLGGNLWELGNCLV